MTKASFDNFHREVNCIYNKERYSVRDNGAVLRHSRTSKRLRSADNQWTFGKQNKQNGYMYISSARIHRIVATAFHGNSPTPKHIVDHIDTNRQNNRPENLRWLTRLENVLLNPVTVKRIELICGSLEAFLENPSILGNSNLDRNFEWMRKVSPQEAQACRERMHLWAKSNKSPSGSGSLGEWIFTENVSPEKNHPSIQRLRPHSERTAFPLVVSDRAAVVSNQEREYEMPQMIADLVMAQTPGAAQRAWRIPSEFPSCPQEVKTEPIKAYAKKLAAGAIFSQNHLSKSLILEAAVVGKNQSICVMCEITGTGTLKPWAVARVTFEDGLYVHASIGTFFTKEGAEKQFCLARGLKWTGGETFDDYC